MKMMKQWKIYHERELEKVSKIITNWKRINIKFCRGKELKEKSFKIITK